MATRDAANALTSSYPAGAILFEENDPGSRMYVIRSGRVRIFRRIGRREIVLAVLGAGDFFGEMALLESLPRSATAEALDPCELVEVDGVTFESMIRTNSEIAVRIMRRLASRVRELDRRLQNLLVDGGVGRAIEVLRWLLPQGTQEEGWVRIRSAKAHVNIAAQAGISPDEAELVLERLRRAGCLKEDGADVLVATTETLDAYGLYLDLKRRYDPEVHELPADLTGRQHDDRRMAVQRLLNALGISASELASGQAALSSQYQRYLLLRQRFEA